MKNHALFFSKDKNKKVKMSSPAIFVWQKNPYFLVILHFLRLFPTSVQHTTYLYSDARENNIMWPVGIF